MNQTATREKLANYILHVNRPNVGEVTILGDTRWSIVATARANAQKFGDEVQGFEHWDSKTSSYVIDEKAMEDYNGGPRQGSRAVNVKRDVSLDTANSIAMLISKCKPLNTDASRGSVIPLEAEQCIAQAFDMVGKLAADLGITNEALMVYVNSSLPQLTTRRRERQEASA